MEILGKTLIAGWDSRWVFKPIINWVAMSGSLCKCAGMLDEIAAVIVGIVVIYLVVRGLVYQYRYITIPGIRNFGRC
jgi:hypothetical protein